MDFNSIQTNLLVSAGTKGEFFVWDTAKPHASPTAYKSSRLDEIISVAWNKKVGHIVALGGKSGALSVWDLRKKSELIHIPTRYAISSIAWHPTEPTLLCTASADDHNPVIQLWDLRNANAPKASLNGHEKGVLSLSWCSKDPELLLSSGSDNRTLIWNPFKALMLAELPASSQWVHKVSWCTVLPSVLANATLDGKITIYSIQDTSTQEIIALVDETPAGDDFFDSIPKNFQAQTSSFTLKQTPRWLKRPVGARFGFGGRIARFDTQSVNVALSRHQVSQTASSTARQIKESLATENVNELCAKARDESTELEKQDWDVIDTLTAEHARGALLKYLGFTKSEVESEIAVKIGAISSSTNTTSSKAESLSDDTSPKGENAKDDQKATESSTSIFGEDAGGDDDFLGIINSATGAPGTSDGPEVKSTSATMAPYSIFGHGPSEPDTLITKAILTGQFDMAINVCLQEDRMSDAFMLALCGGADSQKRVQTAYFQKTNVPYGRLLSSIIAGDLNDIVKFADLKHWREILAVLCNYAKPDDFPDLCEILGQRLESKSKNEKDATLCYLAGSKLDHLVRIWSSRQPAAEEGILNIDPDLSPSEVHTQSLSNLMRKIAVFRKAVAFVDPLVQAHGQNSLDALYKLYLEYAEMISGEGERALALEYLAMVPSSFGEAETLRNRLAIPAANAQAARKSDVRTTGLRNVYPPPVASVDRAHLPASPRPTSSYAPLAEQQNVVPNNVSAQNRSAPKAVHNPYAPPASHNPGLNQPVQSSIGPYGQPQQRMHSPHSNGGYGSVTATPPHPQSNAFVPPPRVSSSGPSILPAAQRKDITPWNDAPDIPLPVPRRATPSVVNRSAIVSPFQAGPTPTLQGFGPPQVQSLGPPPKTRSPAPPRPPEAQISTVPSQPRTAQNPYAPQPQSVGELGKNEPRNSSGSFGNTAIPGSNQVPSRYSSAATNASQQNAFSQQPPPPVQVAPSMPASGQQALFAPPPKAPGGGPPKAVVPRAGVSPSVASPANARGVDLSPEPSRPSTPVLERSALPAVKYAPGDRSHIPESDKPIQQDLSQMVSHLQSVSPERYRRPLDDTARRLGLLFDQLNNNQLTDGTREQLRIMSAGIRNADWPRAYAIHMELTSDKMHECRDWIVGIKTLIVVGKKSTEENWS